MEAGTKEGQDQAIRLPISLARTLESARSEPTVVFDQVQIQEVWQECIKTLKNDSYWRHVRSDATAKWAEDRITALIDRRDMDWWPELLEWYVFGVESWRLARALEFAVHLPQKNTLLSGACASRVAKMLAGKIKKDPFCYWMAPSMRQFFKALLRRIENERGVYYSSDWFDAERALRTVVVVKDIILLEDIKELLDKLTSGQIKAYDADSDSFLEPTHIAAFQTAVDILTSARERQMPYLDSSIGEYFRQKAGLAGGVRVRLDYPEKVAVSREPDKPISAKIRLEVEPTNLAEKDKLLFQLEQHYLHGSLENQYFYSKDAEAGFVGFSCCFDLSLRPGPNRLWMVLGQHQGSSWIMERALYVDVEEDTLM